MSNILANASAWLASQLQAGASQPATCQRGALRCPCQVTLGKTDFQTVTASGAIEQFTSRDFLLPPEKLILGGQVVLPQRGDLWKTTIAGVPGEFQVMAPEGQPVYTLDSQGALLRIHTKQVR